MRFCVYKGISERYKGKYARDFLIPFLTGWSNQITSAKICLKVVR
jgi:hypothetical protein